MSVTNGSPATADCSDGVDSRGSSARGVAGVDLPGWTTWSRSCPIRVPSLHGDRRALLREHLADYGPLSTATALAGAAAVLVTVTSVDEERADCVGAGVRGKTVRRTSSAFQRIITQYLLVWLSPTLRPPSTAWCPARSHLTADLCTAVKAAAHRLSTA